MGFRASRLRRGEILVAAAAAAAVLVIDLFAVRWYSGGRGSASGWMALAVVRWLVLVTVIAGFALAWAQATRPAPALPSTLSVITVTLGLLTTIALLWRVVIDVPGPSAGTSGGAWIALIAGLALFAGAVWSLREEDRPDARRNAAIPIVPLPK